MAAGDKQRLVAFLRNYGDLSKDSLYKGTERTGYKVLPGPYDQVGVRRDPLSLRDLLKDDALGGMMFDDNIDMQATMFEPVGGMDRIPAAFHKSIKSPILLGAEVDFGAPVKQAIAGAKYDYSEKVAFESPRFWEAEQIYGGLSFGGAQTGAVWYPSSGYRSARGIILGAYVAGKSAEAVEALSISKQIDLARNAIDKLHPGLESI